MVIDILCQRFHMHMVCIREAGVMCGELHCTHAQSNPRRLIFIVDRWGAEEIKETFFSHCI